MALLLFALYASAAALVEVGAQPDEGIMLVQISLKTIPAEHHPRMASTNVSVDSRGMLTKLKSSAEMEEKTFARQPILQMPHQIWHLFSGESHEEPVEEGKEVRAPANKRKEHLPFIPRPADRRKGHQMEDQYNQPMDQFDVTHFSSTPWTVGFYFTLIAVALGLWLNSTENHEVVMPEETDPELEYVRGRPCWNSCCVTIYVLMSCFLFFVTSDAAKDLNKHIENKPYQVEVSETYDTSGNPIGIHQQIYMLQLVNPGECAYLASLAIISSMAIACTTIMVWRKYGEVQITTSLLAQFMLRGASLSIVVALMLELSGKVFMDEAGFSKNSWKNGRLGSAVMMLIVGFSEEFAKLIAATCGTCLIVAALPETSGGCWCGNRYCCQALVESRKALALAGLAAGFGFMAVENVEYTLMVLVKPSKTPVGTASGGGEIPVDEWKGPIAILILIIRVLLNIHPWLTGVSLLRIGQVAFEGKHTTACLGPRDIIWAVLPSALVHALYDFLLVAMPYIGVFGVPVIWVCSRRVFFVLWHQEEGANKEDEISAAMSPCPGSARDHDDTSSYETSSAMTSSADEHETVKI